VILADSKTNVKDARQAYLEVLDRMMVLVRQFRDLQGRHVYFTAKQETNDLGQITPSMPGRKLGPSLPYHFDLVFHMELESNAPQPYRFLRTQPDMFSVAKDRSGRLQPIERPDISYIIRTILGT
jgi:hypothetical protein